MARTSYVDGLASALDQAIAELERETVSAAGVAASPATGAPPDVGAGTFVQPQGEAMPGAAPPAAPAQAGAPFGSVPYAPRGIPPSGTIDAGLDQQISRLEQLRGWVRDDPAFGRLVDSMIGRQVQAAERRQRIYSVFVSVASLIIGWLLSTITPLHLLPH
ncbi:MAG: hypothetical protein ACHQ4H_14750 [Ktedonobacterales bacterium]